MINDTPNGVSQFTNLLYLLLHRPLFIAGFSLCLFPVLLNPALAPLRALLAHPFWAAPSRLTYGALLSHGIWMQFREFNSERGTWACGLDAFLFFLAFAAFSFLFSAATAVAWEMPVANMWREFVLRPREEEEREGKRVREAIMVRNQKRRKSQHEEEVAGKVGASLSEIIKSKKRQLAGEESQESIGSIRIKRLARKTSVDTEDLEGAADNEGEDEDHKKLYSYKPKK